MNEFELETKKSSEFLREKEPDFTLLANAMQLKLYSRSSEFAGDSGNAFGKWADLYGDYFRKYVNKNPEILIRYSNHPDEALDEMEEILKEATRKSRDLIH